VSPDASGRLGGLQRWSLTLGTILLVLVIGLWWRRSRRRPMSHAEDGLGRRDTKPLPQAFLYDLSRVTGRQYHKLTSRATLIGRVAPEREEEVDRLIIKRPTIGRRHAVIEYRDYGFWLTDQDSRNGTFVNDKRVVGRVCLRHDDRVRFHDVEFRFVMPVMEETDETQIGEIAAGGDDAAMALEDKLTSLRTMPGSDTGEALAAAPPADTRNLRHSGLHTARHESRGQEPPTRTSARSPQDESPGHAPRVDVDDTLPSKRSVEEAMKDFFEK
jgi:hypothetical protein